jgi:hypothetical protein
LFCANAKFAANSKSASINRIDFFIKNNFIGFRGNLDKMLNCFFGFSCRNFIIQNLLERKINYRD